MGNKILAVPLASNAERVAIRRYRMTRVLQERSRATKAAIKAEIENAKENRKKVLDLQLHIQETLDTLITALDGVSSVLDLLRDKYGDGFYIMPEIDLNALESSRASIYDTIIKTDIETGTYARNPEDGGIMFDEENIDYNTLKGSKEQTLSLIKDLVKALQADKEYEPLVRKVKKLAKGYNKKLIIIDTSFNDTVLAEVESIEDGTVVNLTLGDFFDFTSSIIKIAEKSLSKRSESKYTLEHFKKIDEYLTLNAEDINNGISEISTRSQQKATANKESIKEDLGFVKRYLGALKDDPKKTNYHLKLLKLESRFEEPNVDIKELALDAYDLAKELIDGELNKFVALLEEHNKLYELIEGLEMQEDAKAAGVNLDEAKSYASNGLDILRILMGTVGDE